MLLYWRRSLFLDFISDIELSEQPGRHDNIGVQITSGSAELMVILSSRARKPSSQRLHIAVRPYATLKLNKDSKRKLIMAGEHGEANVIDVGLRAPIKK